MDNGKNRYYVYQYERKGVPVYVSLWANDNYVHAKDIEGHRAFCKWCVKLFGGIGNIRVRILATNLTRKPAMLVRETFTAAYLQTGHDLHSPNQGDVRLVDSGDVDQVSKLNRNANKALKRSRK